MTRALIVDDKEDNVYYLRSLLEAQGCEVASARHGAEALEKARHWPPDIVISDLLMPVMDGYTLLRHWKSDAQLSRTPFIVYTATYTDPDDERLALSLGADAFILKPSEPDDFLARLSEVQAATAAASPAAAFAGMGPGHALLKEYSEALVRKLEQRTVQLEESNRQLQKDLAARERIEAALRESEAKFRLLTELIPQLVWIAGADGANTFCNQRWVDYTGLTLAESRGDGWTRPFHPDDRAAAETAWRQAAETGREVSLELRLRRADGAYRWWLMRALPVWDTNGSIDRWFGSCTDIDELRQAAAKLQRTEEQLRQSQKMEAIGQLAAGVAHDFNNILSVILGYTSFIIEGLKPDDPLRSDVEEIRLAGQRAAALTLRLLTFSRRQVIKPRPVNLEQIVRGVDNMLRRLIGDEIHLSVRAETPLGEVFADPGQIDQIIMNLVVNARDAMPGGGSITIELSNATLDTDRVAEERGVRSGGYTLLAVSDTGHGMDAETCARIFEPFFTTKPKGKGTGLGLATVYGIVTQSGGHIEVCSELGLGTSFRVFLPRHTGSGLEDLADAPSDAELPHRRSGVVPGAVSEALQAPGKRGRILHIDDEESLVQLTTRLLERLGYTVSGFTAPLAALAAFQEQPAAYDAVITDIAMPGMNGLQLVQALQKLRPDVPVVIVSAYFKPEDVREAQALGLQSFLVKPDTVEELGRVLSDEISRHAALRSDVR
jgi:two-component system, cell cycle sensor histidine kinase and response regulator CckA